MRVLITGAGGQLGTELLRRVPARVSVAARTHADLDICSEAAVRHACDELAPDIVINAAAYTQVDTAESRPDLARAANVDAVENLATAVAGRKARLIHMSTDYVFDGAGARPYEVTDATNPLGVYGSSKRDGERRALDILGDRAVVMRCGWLYSAHANNFFTTMLRLMAEREKIGIVYDQIGVPTSAEILAGVLWKICEMPEIGGLLHWSDAGVASWYDFAMAINELATQQGLLTKRVAITPISTAEYPTPARRPRYSVLNCVPTRAALNLPAVYWREALAGVVGNRANA